MSMTHWWKIRHHTYKFALLHSHEDVPYTKNVATLSRLEVIEHWNIDYSTYELMNTRAVHNRTYHCVFTNNCHLYSVGPNYTFTRTPSVQYAITHHRHTCILNMRVYP